MTTRAKKTNAKPVRSAAVAETRASKKAIADLLTRALQALAQHPDASKSSHAQELLRRMNTRIKSLGR